MKSFSNLLIVAGTGRNSGKTTLACRIIARFADAGITALKITPHFHTPHDSALPLFTSGRFNVYLERSLEGVKDSSRMLLAGAVRSFYIQAVDLNVAEAYRYIEVNHITPGTPVICESPSLGLHIEPGILLLADSDEVIKRKSSTGLLPGPPPVVTPGDQETIVSRLGFEAGAWSMTG